MSRTTDAILHQAVAHYGPMHQRMKAIEELGELIMELARPIDREDRAAIVDEIADVRIMLSQLEIIFECRDDVRSREWLKLARLKERMTNADG